MPLPDEAHAAEIRRHAVQPFDWDDDPDIIISSSRSTDAMVIVSSSVNLDPEDGYVFERSDSMILYEAAHRLRDQARRAAVREARARAEPPFRCERCGVAITGRAPHARFCSSRCYVAAHRSEEGTRG
jgi:hypothetical protein